MALKGYVTPHMIAGARVTQGHQNLVIRDYAKRHGLEYLMSATEYITPDMKMLSQVIGEENDGLIMYSLLSLPEDEFERIRILVDCRAAGKEIHGASEGFVIRDVDDANRWEDVLMTRGLIR